MSSSSSIPNLSGRTIDNRYELLSRLGSGSWGIVYKALDLTMSPDDESRFCAIKVVHLKGHKTPITSSLKREMVFHGRVASHPNVVTLRDSFINKEHAVFVMDMSSGGDLEEYIAKKGECTDEAELRSIFSQVLDAVVKLHEEKIYHRDLKPANILLEGDSFTPLLADFGLAVDEPRYRSRCGTQAYMPPECMCFYNPVVPDSASGAASDVWAMGVILLNMLSGHVPWPHARRTLVTFNQYLCDPQHFMNMLPISSETNDLLRAMLTTTPLTRISSREALDRFNAIPSLFREAGPQWTDAHREAWKLREEEAPTIRHVNKQGDHKITRRQPQFDLLSGPPVHIVRCESVPPLSDGESGESSSMASTPGNSSFGWRSREGSHERGSKREKVGHKVKEMVDRFKACVLVSF